MDDGGFGSLLDGDLRDERWSLSPVAWECALCKYNLVAMDSAGRPLPFAAGPGGRILPVACPHCGEEHQDWRQVAPFDDNYAHANIPAAFTGLVHHGNPINPADIGPLVQEAAPEIHEMRRKRDAGLAATPEPPEPEHRVWVCRICKRQLLRHDASGRALEMVRGPNNQPATLDCPKCETRHSKWVLLPLGVTAGSGSSSGLGSGSGSPAEDPLAYEVDEAEIMRAVRRSSVDAV